MVLSAYCSGSLGGFNLFTWFILLVYLGYLDYEARSLGSPGLLGWFILLTILALLVRLVFLGHWFTKLVRLAGLPG